MFKINKFLLKDVRCFKGAKEFNIRPLTFLVGENSTGKSTVLGCFQAMADYLTEGDRFSRGQSSVDFNSDPFQMGSFENIVRRSSPKNREFELGFEFIGNKKTASKFELLIILGEQANSANPAIKKIRFVFDDGEIIFRVAKIIKNNERNEKPEIKIERQNSKKIFTISLKDYGNYSLFHRITVLTVHYYGDSSYKEKLTSEEKQFIKFIRDNNLDGFLSFYLRCFSFAPTSSKPKRTYDPLGNIATSSGGEIPLVLRNLSVKKPGLWKQLYESLKDFGKTSGLFTDIKVKNLGSSLGSPFQLELKIRKGATTNLIDVGFGVSQILPLLVRILMQERYIFLMQQPETHLHPKAEAAFASLLATLAQEKNNAFIIETHSDYMTNRARIDIMKGNIKPEDVSLIYLETQGKDTKVHNLCFDKQGNFENDPPDSYDDFFLSESHKLLGWKD